MYDDQLCLCILTDGDCCFFLNTNLPFNCHLPVKKCEITNLDFVFW